MRSYLSRLLRHLRRRASWALPVELFLFVYFSSWLLMTWAEPDGAGVTRPDTYWWWFAGTVTPAATGPGDHYPSTTAGQLVGVYVIVGGIVTVTMLFTRLAQMIDGAKRLRLEGRQQLKVSGHVTLLGYTAGRTETLIDRLLAEDTLDIVVCAWPDQVEEHPLPDREEVQFVRGNLTDDETLARANLSSAGVVLVDARDDDEALKVTVAASYNNPDTHIVVALQDLAHARTVSRVAAGACCIQWHAVEILTEELQDPGMSRVYRQLMTHSDRNTYSVVVPDTLPGRTFGDFQQALGRWNAATIVALQIGSELSLSPSWSREVPGGATLFYVAKRRLTARDLERYVDKGERLLVATEPELAHPGWGGRPA